jgi:CRISPR-associated exonuclease Cas4
MKIRELIISNWRSVSEQTISFEELVILIGQNNHGKSNILSSLLFFFGKTGLNELDFHRGAEQLFVEVQFSDLDENDKITFKKYLTSSNTIRVRKQASRNGVFSYHGYVETPDEDWLKEENITNYTKRETAETLPLNNLLPSSGRISKESFREAQEQYIEENKETLTFNYDLEPGPFLGAKNVTVGILGDVYFIPSVKRAADDLTAKGRSPFAELYSRVINKMSETNIEFREAKERIATLINILNRTNADGTVNTDRPEELASFEAIIQEELASWDTSIDVEIIPPDLNDMFKVGATVWIDDGIRTDIDRKGQGLQRALIFALVKALAKITREEQEKPREAEEGEAPPSRQASLSTFFIYEEPELYLHPQAQRELFDSLLELSMGNNQVILCTHSSSFLSLEHYKSICIVRKNSVEEGTTVFQCTEELFPDAGEKRLFNMNYWINPDRSEIFFAKKVLLVEGATDKTIIPLLADELGIFRHEYSLIDCGSKDSFPSYIQLVNKFQIPYVAIYDRDHQAWKEEDAKNSADIATRKIEDVIDTTIGSSIVFENDIEEEIGLVDRTAKNKPFYSLAHVTAEGFSMTEALKDKIKMAYQ